MKVSTGLPRTATADRSVASPDPPDEKEIELQSPNLQGPPPVAPPTPLDPSADGRGGGDGGVPGPDGPGGPSGPRASFALEHQHDPNRALLPGRLNAKLDAARPGEPPDDPARRTPEATGEGPASARLGGPERRFVVHADRIEVHLGEEAGQDPARGPGRPARPNEGDDRTERLRQEVDQLRGEAQAYREGASALERERTLPNDLVDAARWRSTAAERDREADKVQSDLDRLLIEKAARPPIPAAPTGSGQTS